MKYYKTFEFCNTESEAKRRCKELNSTLSSYVKKKYPVHYTKWSSLDGKEKKFIVWSVTI